MTKAVPQKLLLLHQSIASKGSILIAFSGGVDSSLLACIAFRSLGDKALAVTVNSQTFPPGELEKAAGIAREIGIWHEIISFNELDEPGFAENPRDRCYFCKKGLFRELRKVAERYGIKTIADGTNISELNGHRPGHRAEIEEGIFTPFVEFKVTKEEIREMARVLGLSVADKPSMACLSSRFPYGQKITIEGLSRVGNAEVFLRGLGLSQVRVRDHDRIARIEVAPQEMQVLIENRIEIIKRLKALGFTYITLDLAGYRSGSMDEIMQYVKS